MSLRLAEKYEDIHATLGLSPDIGREGADNEINVILAQIEANAEKAVAIGEAGLDFQDCKTNKERERQTASFKKVIELSKNLDKSLVVHARLAEAEVLELVKDLDTVIYHCYSGSVETMRGNSRYGILHFPGNSCLFFRTPSGSCSRGAA